MRLGFWVSHMEGSGFNVIIREKNLCEFSKYSQYLQNIVSARCGALRYRELNSACFYIATLDCEGMTGAVILSPLSLGVSLGKASCVSSCLSGLLCPRTGSS